MVSSKRNSTCSNPSTSGLGVSTTNASTNDTNAAMTRAIANTSSSTSVMGTKEADKVPKHLKSECAVCSKFKEGERVLCFEPDPTKVRVVYDAKVLQISVTADEKKSKSSNHEFLVHFQGWNASWDRFVPLSYLLKDNQENRNLQKTLFDKADQLSKSKKKKKKTKSGSPQNSLLEAHATPSEGSSTAGTDGEEDMEDLATESCTSTSPISGNDNQAALVHQDEKIITFSHNSKISINSGKNKKVSSAINTQNQDVTARTSNEEEGADNITVTPICLSDTLKRHLEEDYVNVTKKRRLSRVPAEPSAIKVLEDYVRNYAAARMVSYEKQRSKTFYTSNRREEDKLCYEKAVDSINIAKEVAEGVRILLDFNLENILLYDDSGEQEQYKNLIKHQGCLRDCINSTKGKSTLIGEPKPFTNNHYLKTNSNECLVEEIKENLMVEGTRVHNVANSTHDKPNLMSMSALRERRKVSLSLEPKYHSVNELDQMSTKQNIQSGGCSSKGSTTSGRSLATPTQSLLSPPASSPTTPQATQLMRSIHEWRLVPPSLLQNPKETFQTTKDGEKDTLHENAEIIASSMYGPMHLLRLFVKMPEILGRMKIPQKRSKLLLKYIDSLLEYLEGQPSLFDTESVYV